MNQYDLIVIGAGPGGYVASIRAAQLGMKVAVVERDAVGGTCLNRGCIPTKALLHAGEILEEMKEAKKLGLSCDNISYDMAAVYKRRDDIVKKLRGGVEMLLKGNGIDLYRGHGSFVDKNTVCVTSEAGEEHISAKYIIIAVGSEVRNPNFPGIELAVDSDDILEKHLDIPQNVAIAGASVIGVEFAEIMHALGKNVTIIATRDRLLPKTDKDLGVELGKVMKRKGIKILYKSRMKEIQKTEDGVEVFFTTPDGVDSIKTEMLIACIGRSPYLEGLKPENAGVVVEGGKIVVDENLKTATDNIYAIGDCLGGDIQLAHWSEAQGVVVVERILGKEQSYNLDVCPACVYTSPEIANVGLTEEECAERGIEIEVGKYNMGGNGKSMIVNQAGFVKVLFEKGTEKMVGAAMFCNRATDIIGELAVCVATGMTRHQFLKTIHPHPTVVEGVMEAVEASEGMSIHSPKAR